MLDPQTLIGLKISEAVNVLFEHKHSFGYTYQESRFEEGNKPERYCLLLDKTGVVSKAKIG